MRYVFISDDQGNALYFDHPRGMMICPPIATTQAAMFENFAERMTCISTPFFNIVFEWHEHISLCIVSDEGEPESFLRNELKLIYEILLMIMGPKLVYARVMPSTFTRHQKLLQKIIDTASFMIKKQQSFLVKAIENLDVNEHIQAKCQMILKKHLDKLPNALHGLLFVKTKLISSYSKPRSFDLDPTDILLLITLFKGHFNPNSREELVEMSIPIADYSQNERQKEETASIADEEEYISATEDFEEELKFDALAFLQSKEAEEVIEDLIELLEGLEEIDPDESKAQFLLRNFLAFVINTTEKEAEGIMTRLNQIKKIMKEGIQITKGNQETKYSRGSGAQSVRQFDPIRSEEIALLQLLLNQEDYEGPEDGLVSIQLTKSVNRFSKKNAIPVSNEEIASANMIRELVKKVAKSDPYDLTRLSMINSNSDEALSSHLKASLNTQKKEKEKLKVEEQKKVPAPEPVYQSIHLRTPSYNNFWVYLSVLDEGGHTLVVINTNSTGKPEEKEQLKIVDGALRTGLRDEMTFTRTKEMTHLSMLSYFHQFPGLVHFIFVDRTTNRVIAPTISPQHGLSSMQSEDASSKMVKVIEKEVWQLVYQAQKHLSMGYYSMLMKNGEFQYSYRLILDDPDGFEINLEQPIHNLPSSSQYPCSHQLYKEILKKYKVAKCYELYTLYLNVVSVNIIAQHDRSLLNQLKKSE